MSLVAAYSDSDSEADSDNEDEPKQLTAASQTVINQVDLKKTQTVEITTKLINSGTEENNLNKTITDTTSTSSEEISENDTGNKDDGIGSNTATVESSFDSQIDLFHSRIEDDDDWLQHADTSKNKDDQAVSLFSILPQPTKTKRVETMETVEETDDEFLRKKAVVTEEVKKVEGEEDKALKRSLLTLPKPSKKSGKKKQMVQILIPTLDEIGADSDEEKEKEEDEGKEKKITFESTTKSTLFAMLPKPRHSVTVGANKNKVFSRDANRPLVPHTLTKKKETITQQGKTKTDKKKTNVKSLVSADQSDSDSDGDAPSDNFFSLGGNKQSEEDTEADNLPDTAFSTSTSVKQTSQISSPASKKSKTSSLAASGETTKNVSISVSTDQKKSVSSSNTKGNTFFANLFKSNKTDNTVASSPTSAKSSCTENRTTTSHKPTESVKSGSKEPSKHISTYNKNITEPYSNVTAPYSNVTEPYSGVTGPYSDVTASYSSVTAPYSDVISPYGAASTHGNITASYGGLSAYNGSDASSQNSTATSSKSYPTQPFFSYEYHNKDQHDSTLSQTELAATEVDYYNKPNADLPIEADALRALQGRKRHKEDINLIDINADDIQADPSQSLRNLTAESGYKPQSNSKDQPSSSQKRKHQITYLAFQAKEREFQLQQSWAESAASKRQTQSKYGF